MTTTIKLKEETLKELRKVKANYDFSSYDALITTLISNTKRLEKILK